MGEDTDDQVLRLPEIKALLGDTFKGVSIRSPNSMGASFHADLDFYEYSVRVILTNPRTPSEARSYHYKFYQDVSPREGQKPVRREILNIHTEDPDEIRQAIMDTKAHLMGVVFAILKALRSVSVPKVTSIDDLFSGLNAK